jgi:hypothetical protein
MVGRVVGVLQTSELVVGACTAEVDVQGRFAPSGANPDRVGQLNHKEMSWS